MCEVAEILLAEDNPNDVELTLRALQKANLAQRIEVVRDGAEALDFIFCTGAYAHRSRENGPQLILLDLKMPKVDGLEVLRRVKVNPHTPGIPVIVHPSSREGRDRAQRYQVGAKSHLDKPVNFTPFPKAHTQ